MVFHALRKGTHKRCLYRGTASPLSKREPLEEKGRLLGLKGEPLIESPWRLALEPRRLAGKRELLVVEREPLLE